MGTLVTFYSYKGGVGRTMALANIAVLLARWGKNVLIVDWDLEAPGIEHFFVGHRESAGIQKKKGLVDLLTSLSEASSVEARDSDWKPLLVDLRAGAAETTIQLLTAGARTGSYFESVRRLDVKQFYEEKNGGRLIESLRKGWKEHFDFILVDSRTGITDIGGICTIQLPDILALVFTATEQSLDGAVKVATKAAQRRQELPFDRSLVPAIPIPSRFDTQTEHAVSKHWLELFEKALTPLYHQWLPKSIDRQNFLALTKIPYAAYFSFGERLAVVEQGTTDPAGLGYAYETVAALIGNELHYADILIGNRDEFVQMARLPNRFPKLPLRDLPHETVLFVDFVGLSLLNDSFVKAATPLRRQEQLRTQYQGIIGDAAKKEGGELAESDGFSFLFAFPSSGSSLRCALSIQDAMLVKTPVFGPNGPFRVRMAVHSSDSKEPDSSEVRKFKELRDIAALAADKAQAGEIVISNSAQEGLSNPPDGISFLGLNEPIEFAAASTSKHEIIAIPLSRVVSTVQVDLTPAEHDALFAQDPRSRGGGGFQALLVSLQERVGKDNRLSLTVWDRERIARYAHDYRSGGWQGLLRKIFGRTLGPNLGRG